MRIPTPFSIPVLVALLLLVPPPLRATGHSEGYPVEPTPLKSGASGGRPGGVPTLPGGGVATPGAGGGSDGAALDWELWWRWNRETLIDFPALRRARRARAGLPTEMAPGVREAALAELRSAAAEPSGTVALSALLALGRARDATATPLLAKQARAGRESALLGLGLLSPSAEARKTLLDALGNAAAPSRLRSMAALALGLSGDLAALPALAARVRSVSESAEVVEACLIALAALENDAAIRDLKPRLMMPTSFTDRSSRRASFVAFACGRIGADGVTAELRRALRHPAIPFRRQAALSLGAIAQAGSAAARDLRIITTGHPDSTVRSAAALGLSGVEAPAAEDALLILFADPSAALRSIAAPALARWDARASATHLAAALAREKDPGARGAIAAAMGLAQRPSAVAPLRPVLTEFGPPEVRGHAALALGILGDGPSRESIRRLLVPPSPRAVRRDAALAAGLLGDRAEEKDAARRLIEEESEQGRAAAALALGDLGSPDAVPILTRVLRDRGNPEAVRTLAAVSLGRLLDDRSQSPATRLAAGLDPFLASTFLREVLSWF